MLLKKYETNKFLQKRKAEPFDPAFLNFRPSTVGIPHPSAFGQSFPSRSSV
jgi:hypothetical protein